MTDQLHAEFRKNRNIPGRITSGIFTEQEVRDIRNSKFTIRKLAKLYDCGTSTINRIRQRETYAHVKDEPVEDNVVLETLDKELNELYTEEYPVLNKEAAEEYARSQQETLSQMARLNAMKKLQRTDNADKELSLHDQKEKFLKELLDKLHGISPITAREFLYKELLILKNII